MLFEDPPELQGDKPVLMPMQLDLLERGRVPYQQGAKRVIWQGPCGSGKTIIAAEQTASSVGKKGTILHIVHRRRLVDQMIWTLERFGIRVAPIMDGRERWSNNVYCASRDTLLAMVKSGVRLPQANLIIWDEAHVAANAIQDWYLRNIPDAYWTGYTATPVCADGRSMNPPYQALVCMGSTAELIKVGRLCPVKVYSPDAVGVRRRKGDKVKPVGDPVAHWRKYADGLPTVVYAANVADSKNIVQRYLDAGITAEHMDASTSEDDRESIFDRSKSGQTKIISNCGVLIEGVDLPWLVCCQILRGCNSLVLWIQASGRVMRAFVGKTHGIILDHAGAAHEYGLPDGEFHWSLEDGATNTKKNKPPKDRAPQVCMGCGFVFVGKPACPQCGNPLSAKKRRSLVNGQSTDGGVLTEFTGSQNGHAITDKLMRIAKKAYYVARSKGGTMGMANAIFSQEAKIPMWNAGLPLNLPRGKAEWQTPAKDWRL